MHNYGCLVTTNPPELFNREQTLTGPPNFRPFEIWNFGPTKIRLLYQFHILIMILTIILPTHVLQKLEIWSQIDPDICSIYFGPFSEQLA